jgi:hypothetical protein
MSATEAVPASQVQGSPGEQVDTQVTATDWKAPTREEYEAILKKAKKSEEIEKDNYEYRERERVRKEQERTVREEALKAAEQSQQYQKAWELTKAELDQTAAERQALAADLEKARQRAILADQYESQVTARVDAVFNGLTDADRADIRELWPDYDQMSVVEREARLMTWQKRKQSQTIKSAPGGASGILAGNGSNPALEQAAKAGDIGGLFNSFFAR